MVAFYIHAPHHASQTLNPPSLPFPTAPPPPILPQCAHTTHSHLTAKTKISFPSLGPETNPPLLTTHNLTPISQVVHLTWWHTFYLTELSWTTSNPDLRLACLPHPNLTTQRPGPYHQNYPDNGWEWMHTTTQQHRWRFVFGNKTAHHYILNTDPSLYDLSFTFARAVWFTKITPRVQKHEWKIG